ncbi:MAG: N-acetyltransferase [bacterium]|nr:N-acetyltransferase [bacterium]
MREERTIRRAAQTDAPAINRIYNEAIDLGMATADTKHVPLSFHEKWLAEHSGDSCPVLVALSEKTVIGWNSLSYYRSGRPAVLGVRETSYYVDKNHQRAGVAAELMNSILELCPAIGVSVLITYIIEENTASINFMEKFSFKLWGRLPEVISLSHGTFDHLLFGKKIGDNKQ